MTDPNELEVAAMEHAGQMAGHYIEEVGKTDLATFSSDEYMTLISVICKGYINHLAYERDLATQTLANDAMRKVNSVPL